MPHPRELNLSRLAQEIREGRELVQNYPPVLYLEATAACNLRCPMCPTTMGLPRDPYRTKMFDLGLLRKVEPILFAVKRAFLSGGGEPLLHPRFFDIVRALKERAVEVYFNCNATLLDEARAREMVETGVDTVSFSVDGATAAVYESIRVGGDFERTVANIRRLAEIKSELGSPRPYLNLQFTVLDENAHEVEAIVEVAAFAGVHHLVIEPLTPIFNFDPQYRAYYEAHRVGPEAILDQLRRAEARARELGLVFSSHYLFAADHAEPARSCCEPWLTFGVRVDGRVFTCCGAIEVMGDLATQSFEEIWNGPAYRSLRRALARGEFPDFCSLCIRENRANHFNEDLAAGQGR
jgi:MoaA/NifB/PqqE/SkfB family radical SAM enzyme